MEHHNSTDSIGELFLITNNITIFQSCNDNIIEIKDEQRPNN